jgi:N-acyl-D-amino-acid deacylase
LLRLVLRLMGLLAMSAVSAWGNDAEQAPELSAVRSAIARSIPLLEAGAKGSLAQRKNCFTCHNQGLPIMALTAAHKRGFAVDVEHLRVQVQFTADFLARNRDNYRKGQGQGGQVDTAGYALWTLHEAGWRPDDTTAAVAEYFLLRQSDQDYYEPTARRPPSEQSAFTSTYVALRGMTAFGTAEQRERISQRKERVGKWLLNTPATDTEDRVFRLRALRLIAAPDDVLRQAQDELLQTQRPDGGWAQLSEMESDAYATSTVLLALAQAGDLTVEAPPFLRGVRYLLETQGDDGSWHVATRSKPFQTYFESGFPHGKDQFISIAASAWATWALCLMLPEQPPIEPPETP